MRRSWRHREKVSRNHFQPLFQSEASSRCKIVIFSCFSCFFALFSGNIVLVDIHLLAVWILPCISWFLLFSVSFLSKNFALFSCLWHFMQLCFNKKSTEDVTGVLSLELFYQTKKEHKDSLSMKSHENGDLGKILGITHCSYQ